MQKANFFEHFCGGDEEKALNKLYDFIDLNYGFLKISAWSFLKTSTDVARTEADIMQEVIIYFWENRQEICNNNQNDALKYNKDFMSYFLQSVKNKCIDYERKNEYKFNPKKISEREKKENRWQNNYGEQKEDQLTSEGGLNALELEAVTVFALRQISDHFKLLINLNLTLSYKKLHYNEMQQKGWLFHQLGITTDLSNFTPLDIYKMKSKDVRILLDIETENIKKISYEIRKFKQYIKRKLNRKGLWKSIQHS